MKIVSLYGLEKGKETQSFTIPIGAKVLSVCVRQEKLYVSVEEDSLAYSTYMEREGVEFAIIKEGRHFYTDEYQFLGTVVFDFGNTIYNVFYRKV